MMVVIVLRGERHRQRSRRWKWRIGRRDWRECCYLHLFIWWLVGARAWRGARSVEVRTFIVIIIFIVVLLIFFVIVIRILFYRLASQGMLLTARVVVLQCGCIGICPI